MPLPLANPISTPDTEEERQREEVPVPTGLGTMLAEARKQRDWSLREVERRTGIHNAHLSQIETGGIVRPDPNILWELARVYNLDFDELMVLAGHVRSDNRPSSGSSTAAVAWRALDGLSPEQQREALEYLQRLLKESGAERSADQ